MIITKNSRRVYLRWGFQHKQQIIFDLQTKIFDMACERCHGLGHDLIHQFNYDVDGASILQSCNEVILQGFLYQKKTVSCAFAKIKYRILRSVTLFYDMECLRIACVLHAQDFSGWRYLFPSVPRYLETPPMIN
jgi:phosphorylcholine metabolism protein LicD